MFVNQAPGSPFSVVREFLDWPTFPTLTMLNSDQQTDVFDCAIQRAEILTVHHCGNRYLELEMYPGPEVGAYRVMIPRSALRVQFRNGTGDESCSESMTAPP